MSSSVNLQDFRIPLEELKRATSNFDSSSITKGGYRGELSERWQNRTAFIKRYNKEEFVSHEPEIVSQLHHEDITSFIGYCDEDDDYIYMAYEYFAHKSLDDILKTDSLTWASRLKICIRVAIVLNYLHSGVGEQGRVIHGDVKCENILLNKDNLERIKVCGFKHSKLVPLNQPHQHHSCPEELYKMFHTDPIYKETSLLNTESDIYSFGVLMFVILHGIWPDENHHQLMNLVRGCYNDGPYKLVDPSLNGNCSYRSVQIFTTLAYKCISFDIKERPRMVKIIKTIEEALYIHNHSRAFMNPQTLKKFKIPLEEIRKAIGAEDFDRRISSTPHRIMTHRGKLADRCNDREAFFKHLPYMGTEIFRMRNELLLISSFHHENITPFIGHCVKNDEIIIASEYALNGSLYLKLETQHENGYLTWAERLKICLGAARGLKYIHAGFGVHKVIHGDFKSKNILLYDNLEAKICGFGKSFLVPKSHPDTNVYKEARGSKYYMDPVYRESLIPRVESDVYSFGVVLFEVLTGCLACHPVEGEQISMINWVRRYNDKIDKLIDYRIRDETDARSLNMFKGIAYKCISYNMKDRPSMNQVAKRLEEALYIQTHGAASTIARNNEKLEDFRIPLKDINLAIGEKGPKTQIGDGGFGIVYKGQLSERWQNRTVAIKSLRPASYQGEQEFRKELNMIFNFNHENIIPFIGYCDEENEKIIVYEYASNGSLDRHLEDKEKRRFLKWEHRLKICLGAAKGIDYLHSDLGMKNRVIHRDVKSANILLDHNFVAKVSDFGLSKSGPINQQDTQVYTNAAGTSFYMDPVYQESGVLRKESDVYSFGVVMFELLSGMLAYHKKRLEDGKMKPLINIVRRYYDRKPGLLIDPLIKYEIDDRSFDTFKEVAFQCISFNSKERPTMETIVDRVEEALELQTHGAASTIARQIQKLEDFRIPLEDINLAIGVKGHETRIGDGGFGFVYKGQRSERWQNRTVAIKRLRPDSYQGEHEFRNELNMIFRFSHENIIPFIGYCDEGKEKIIVYEYASNGSLDHHLEEKEKRRFLTWEHRLKICLGAARGLDYLHSGLGEENRVIHGDVKSRNILLDHNFVAKVCDFGLSKSGPINQQHTQLYTKAAGTNYNMDPVYHESGVLRKESDVYSFGVVMFELLSGMLAYHQRKLEDGKPKPLLHIVRRYYNHKPDLLIDPLIKDEIDNRSFDAYREVAYQCISFNSKERPTMEMIVDRVEEALELQVTNQGDLKQKVTET